MQSSENINFKFKKHKFWLDQYLVNCSDLNKSPHTIMSYRKDIVRYIHWFESTQATTLNFANSFTINEYVKSLINPDTETTKITTIKSSFWSKVKNLFHKKTNQSVRFESHYHSLAVNSRKRHLSSIKNFYEYLKQTNEDHNKLFNFNPVKSKIHNIKLKDEDVNHTAYLTVDDWMKLDERIYRPKERLIIHLLYFGGLRLSELTFLKYEDFSQTKYCLTFRRKGGKIHTLIPEKPGLIWECLEKYLNKTQIYSGYLFPNKNNKAYATKTLYNLIMRMFTDANCSKNLTPHSFRKACATNLYLKTKDLLLVRDYLNHSDAKVTQSYIDKEVLFSSSLKQ